MIYTIRPSSVCLWHLRQWEPTRSRHGWVHIVYHALPPTKPPTSYHQLVRTCRISSFCTVAWQLARLLLTRRIVQSLGDSWASCVESVDDVQLYMCCTESNAMSKVSCRLNGVTAGASILTDTSCKVLSSPLRLWASLFYSHCLPKCLSSETGSTKCCKYCRDTTGVLKSLTVSVFVCDLLI